MASKTVTVNRQGSTANVVEHLPYINTTRKAYTFAIEQLQRHAPADTNFEIRVNGELYKLVNAAALAHVLIAQDVLQWLKGLGVCELRNEALSYVPDATVEVRRNIFNSEPFELRYNILVIRFGPYVADAACQP